MDPATSAAQEFLKLGVPGAVIIFLGLAIIILWRKLNEKDNVIAALQESRLADVRKSTEALVNAAASMTGMRDTVSQLDESLRTLVAEYQARRPR